MGADILIPCLLKLKLVSTSFDPYVPHVTLQIFRIQPDMHTDLCC